MKLISIFSLVLIFSSSAFGQMTSFSDCWEYRENLVLLSEGKGDSYQVNLKVLQDLKGIEMPDFTGKTIDGEVIKKEDLKGKVVVMNFWFIYCSPCVAEMPALNKLKEEYSEEEVIFLAFGQDSQQDIQTFLPKNPFNYLQIYDAKWATDTFCAMGGFPMNMVFDKNGKLTYVSTGGNPDLPLEKYEELKPEIDKILGGK